MKVTIVLIADINAENYGRRLMLAAHRAGNVGFEMARLPLHVSLKQPFQIFSLEEMEDFFDEFAKEVPVTNIKIEELEIYPNNVIGGEPSGCLSIKVRQSEDLKSLQRKLFARLEERFGSCPAEHDNDYVFHMTVAIGGTSYENYQKAYNELTKLCYQEELTFGKLGLLYYDDDGIKPGTYFCYKQVELV